MSYDYRDTPEWAALGTAIENFVVAHDKNKGEDDTDMLLQEFVITVCRVPIEAEHQEFTAMNYCFASSKIGHHVTGLLRDALEYCTARES